MSELQGQLPECYNSWEAFLQAQFLETNYLLPGYILSSQGDRVAMAHAVEGRFPFLDYRVVEFAVEVADPNENEGASGEVLAQTMRGRFDSALGSVEAQAALPCA